MEQISQLRFACSGQLPWHENQKSYGSNYNHLPGILQDSVIHADKSLLADKSLMTWMRPTNSFVLKTPYKKYLKKHHSTTSKSFDQCCFPAAFQDMRTMENGLPFATPVLKLFQRLPVEEKAGAITYVAVTSVAWRRKQWSSGQCRRIGSFNGTSFWRVVSSQMTVWTYSEWIACHEFRQHWWICTCTYVCK